MNPILFFVIAAVILILIGAYLTRMHYAPVIKEAREAAEAQAREAAELERRVREANDRANFKLDVATVMNELIQNPEWLRGRSDLYRYRKSFKALHEFIGHASNRTALVDRLRQLEEAVQTQGIKSRELTAQQKEIIVALQLGKPVEM